MAKFCGARVIFRGNPVLHHIHYLNHYIVSEFCTTERIPYMTRNLTTVHRNSHKVASYLCECTPHIDTLVCTSPHGGDGVYVEHMSNIRENSGNNELLMYINRLTDPDGQINQGSVTRVYPIGLYSNTQPFTLDIVTPLPVSGLPVTPDIWSECVAVSEGVCHYVL